MEINLENDITKLTTIPTTTLKKIGELKKQIIASTVSINHKCGIPITEIETSLGTLTIENQEDIIVRFTPNLSLTQLIKKACEGEDILVERLEEKITEKIMNVYKDLL